MYKYVITFEGLKADLTLTPTSPIDPITFVENMNLDLFNPQNITSITITPFPPDLSNVVGK
jgi:hypothetical protein